MNYARLAGFAGLWILTAMTATAAPCPSGSPATASYSMAVKPDLPKAGQTMNVTLDARIALPFTVCVDGETVEPRNVNVADATYFEFQMPSGANGGDLTGIHSVSVLAANAIYSAKIGNNPLVLTSVTSVPLGPGNNTFRVRLNGEGFDVGNKSYNKIQLNDYPFEVCWSDSECAARNLLVRGDVLSGGRVIEITGMDPVDERSARFRVWVNARATDERTDSEVNYQYWVVVAVAAATTLTMMGLVLWLVKKYLRPTVIEGDHYVGRALFMDKETNTYSLSKLQFYLWTIVAVFGYVYLAVSKNWFQHFFSLPAVPSGLPGIVAIAGGAAVGSQVITNINGPKGAGQLKPSLADFVTTGDVVAAERVQFLVWTIIGAIGFLMVVMRLDPRVLRDLPDIPSSVLAISGLSAFGYLGGKLARDPGPNITEAMVSTGPDPDSVPSAAAGLPTASPTFGRIELRGRMLSRDANFRVSPGEESTANDVDISFDQLQPSAKDDKHLKKPRIVENDTDSSDPSMAKRLLLVINITDNLRAVFAAGSTRTITVINPDSQKAVFKFRVPESQKPG